MPIHYDYIKSFLGLKEGYRLDGYVPMQNGQVMGQSGVTIGKGVDLGQQDAMGLAIMGVPSEIINKLRPYFGLKKAAAVSAIKSRPLTLTEEEAATLSECVANHYIHSTRDRFNRRAVERNAFEAAPKQVQAVAVSLEYQRGPAWAREHIALLAGGNYKSCVRLLESDTEYVSRRKSEAALIREVM